MVGFWLVDINGEAAGRANHRRGGGLSLPRPVRSTQWPNDLILLHPGKRDDDGAAESETKHEAASADPTMVRCCQPAFVRVPAIPSNRPLHAVPVSIQQRFWVADAGAFRRALLDGSVE